MHIWLSIARQITTALPLSVKLFHGSHVSGLVRQAHGGTVNAVSNVIMIDRRLEKDASQRAGLRDRRYAIRYPFAADAEFIDLESGTQVNGITCDISLGGCFICTSKPLAAKSRARFTLTRKGQSVRGLAVIRIVKARVGMGIEFLDIEPGCDEILHRWIDQLRNR